MTFKDDLEQLEAIFKVGPDGKVIKDSGGDKPTSDKPAKSWFGVPAEKSSKSSWSSSKSSKSDDSSKGVGPDGSSGLKPEKPEYKKPEKWISAGGVVLGGVDDLDHVYIRKPSGNFGPWCFDDQTDILTRRGWLKGLDLQHDDEVATLVDGALVYERPHAINVVDYEGELLHFSSQHLDQMVTPNHRMWVCREQRRAVLALASGDLRPARYSETRFEHVPADEVPLSASFKRDVSWTGEDHPFFRLAPLRLEVPDRRLKAGFRVEEYPELLVPMNDWVQLLAWVLSEGYASKPNGYSRKGFLGKPFVAITQNEGIEAEEIRILLKRLPLTVYEHKEPQPSGKTKITFRIQSRQLWLELYDGKRAPAKRIPRYVSSLSPTLIRKFLNTYRRGDGGDIGGGRPRWIGSAPSTKGRPRKTSERSAYSPTPVYYTASPSMADDLSELILKSGDCPRLRTRTSGHNRQVFNVTACKPHLKCCPSKVERVAYSGKVWCPSTTSGVVYVRRNGKSSWSGNSFAKGRIDKGETQEQAALREVEEEIGIVARIIPGGYLGLAEGSMSHTHYYLMVATRDLGRHDEETDKVLLATWTEAIHKFAKGGNSRDIKILTKAMDLVEKVKRKRLASGNDKGWL
jgi:ADP-ribose pyrophosphatase YjhB (NUDIX family)